MAEKLAFYAPLKSPRHPIPSGDRRMARSLIEALERGGRQVELASRLRSFDRNGEASRQRRIERLGGEVAERLIQRYRARPRHQQPKAWITYHAYQITGLAGTSRQARAQHPLSLDRNLLCPKAKGWTMGHRPSGRRSLDPHG